MMSRYDARIKAVERRMPRDYGDGARVNYVEPLFDAGGRILNPDDYFQDDTPDREHIYIGYTAEEIKSIEDQRFQYWQNKDEFFGFI